jgi:radical SAM protein with 4Fe4S-binding SPASM domain
MLLDMLRKVIVECSSISNNFLKKQVKKMYKMKELSIEITYKCPFNCVMCSSRASLDKDMPYIQVEKIKEMIIDAKENCGTTEVSLSGGEPMFHPNAVEIIEFIYKHNLKPIIYTIGVDYVDDKFIDLRQEYIDLYKRVGAKIILPLHGLAKTHNQIVNQDVFDYEINTIRRLVEVGIETQIHFVPTNVNCSELLDVYLLCNELGVDKMSILRYVPQGRATEHDELDLNQFELGLVNGILYTLKKVKKFSTDLRIGIPMDFLFLLDNDLSVPQCDGGKTKILVRATGQVNVCPAWKELEEYDAGNIYDEKISEIWKNSKTYCTFREFNKYKLRNDCISCEFLHSCKGGCVAQRIIDYKQKNPNIDIEEVIYKGKDWYCIKKYMTNL